MILGSTRAKHSITMSDNMYDNSLYVLLAGHGLLLHGGKKNATISDDIKSGKKELNENQKRNLEKVVQPLIERIMQENEVKDILAVPEFTGSEASKKELLLKIIEYAKSAENPDPKLDETEKTLKNYEPKPENENEDGVSDDGEDEEELRRKEEEARKKQKEIEEQRKKWKDIRDTGENGDSEADDEEKIPRGKIVVNDGLKKKLYSSKNKDATDHWPYRMSADTQGICILYEKKTKIMKDKKEQRMFGVQFEKEGFYVRELWEEGRLSTESPASLQDWDANGCQTAMDQIDPDTGIVTETQPGENDRLVFQTSDRKYTKSYGVITKVLFLLMNDYKSSVRRVKKPKMDYCVLFSKTKYPKIIRPSDLANFTPRGAPSKVLKALIKRDNLGSLKEHTPLQQISYNPESRFFDSDLHGAYVIRTKEDPKKEEQENTIKEED